MKIQPILKTSFYKVYNKITRSFYLTVAIFISIPFLLISCGSCEENSIQLGMVTSSSYDSENSLGRGTGSPNQTPSQSKSPIFFLVPGLGANADSCNSCAKGLSEQVLDALTMTLNSVTSEQTGSLSISEQAKMYCQEILAIDGIKDPPIVLIGHSQGGLCMARLVIECKNQGLNVQRLVMVNTPFKGASVLGKFKDLLSLDKACQESLKKHSKRFFEKDSESVFKCVEPFIVALIKNLANPFYGADDQLSTAPGIQDLIPNSPFLRNLHKELPELGIPILAIGGEAPKIDFCKTLAKKKEDSSTILDKMCMYLGMDKDKADFEGKLNAVFNCVLDDVLVGENSAEGHDVFFSIGTQLGKTAFNGCDKFKTHIVKDTIHSDFLNSYLVFCGMESGVKPMGTFDHPETVEEIVKFATSKG